MAAHRGPAVSRTRRSAGWSSTFKAWATRLRSLPGRTGRSRWSAVDAEVVIDGRLVAVEVTQLLPGARAHYEIIRLEKEIEGELKPLVAEHDLGYVAISVHYRRLPPKSVLRAAIPVLVEDLRSGIRQLQPRPGVRVEFDVETSVAFIRRLELLQLPNVNPGSGWIGGSDEFGGWIDPIADAFVAHLLDGKPARRRVTRKPGS